MWEGKGGGLARSCWKQLIRSEVRNEEKSKWENRRKFFTDRGIARIDLEERRRSGEIGYDTMVEKDKQLQEKERWEEILESR